VSLPSVVGPRGRLPIFFGVWRYRDSGVFNRTHLRFYSIKTGRALVIEVGFTSVDEALIGPLTTIGGRPLKTITAL
jgi:hypothetical protein